MAYCLRYSKYSVLVLRVKKNASELIAIFHVARIQPFAIRLRAIFLFVGREVFDAMANLIVREHERGRERI